MSETPSKKSVKSNGASTKRRGRKPKGLGDTIENITEATGIKKLVKWVMGEDCGCDQRKEKLNKLFPYAKPKCLTEQEYNILKDFKRPVNKVEVHEQAFLAKTHSRVFGHPYHMPSCNCTAAFNQFLQWYDELKEIISTYDMEQTKG
jgi:hypothetical protein